MTRSPGENPATPAPTLSTSPANSAAGENGKAGLCWYLPAMIRVSKKFSAAALTRTTASPGPGDGVGEVGKFEVVGGAVTGAEQGFHGGSIGYATAACLARCPAGLAALGFGL